MKINMLSLFSGIGGFEKGFINAGYKVNVVAISEIYNPSIIAYKSIYGDIGNVGDITKLDPGSIKDKIDIIVHGSPCQSFSKEGKGEGAAKGSDTKSSLVWETIRIAKQLMPKVIIWENVAAARSYNDYFDYMERLEAFGYYNREYLLNARDFGIPQNRRRIVIVSTLQDIELKDFPEYMSPNIRTFLTPDNQEFKIFNDKYRLTMPVFKTNELLIRNGTKAGFVRGQIGDIVDMAFPKSKTRRARIIKDRSCPTILTSAVLGVITPDLDLRYLTAEEAWLLMGRTQIEYKAAYKALIENNVKGIESKLYFMAGNSIVPQMITPIAEELKQLFKEESQ